MTITLDSIPLSSSMIWADKHKQAIVAQTALVTLGGGSVVYSKLLTNGQPVTLEARLDTGWITKTMLDALTAIAIVAGGVYTLDVHGVVMSVMFRHQEPPALSFEPLIPKDTPVAGDYYVGTLKLFTV